MAAGAASFQTRQVSVGRAANCETPAHEFRSPIRSPGSRSTRSHHAWRLLGRRCSFARASLARASLTRELSDMSLQESMQALAKSFLGASPGWYKRTIVAFLVVNPILFTIDPYVAGWALVLEFIFTLAMALSCYPLQPGGLLAFEAVAIGMTSPQAVYAVTAESLEVVLLLIFMVAGIFFLKDLLLYTFTKLVVGVRSKVLLSLLFSGVAAVL